jgi:hypothetical protein
MKALPYVGLAVIAFFLGSIVFFSGLVYVGPQEALVLTARFGDNKPSDRVLAEKGQRGIQKNVLGVGYHWIAPVLYEHQKVSVVHIEPGKVGILTALDGIKPEGERFLAEKGEIGIRRRVLGPGTYRLNPFQFKVNIENQTQLRPGTVGVLVDRQKGGVVKDRVLQPGVHYINPRQYKVEEVRVGINEYTLSSRKPVAITADVLLGEVDLVSDTHNPNRILGGAITFPSQDGFTVGLDITVLWELTPKNAIKAVDTYGDDDILVQRVIHPMLNSASRNDGSQYSAKEMIQGVSRARFKRSFTSTLMAYTSRAPLDILAALPRRVFVPVKIQLPIMQAQLKNEELLTNKEIEETSKVEAKLEKQVKLVDQEIEQVKADTRVLRLSIQAEAQKEYGEFEAETRLRVARIQLDVQKLDTVIADIRSKAEASVIEYRGIKEGELNRLRVEAFGSSRAYNAYVFASNALPDGKLPIRIIHAGEGTFWTDLSAGASKPELKALDELRRLQRILKEKNGDPEAHSSTP